MAESDFASRAGVKLAAALDAFDVNVAGMVCADLGSHTGGFVDCLLKNGAARVYAVDTGYGVLEYRLRRDPRVVVCERQNALHYRCPDPCDLITIDVGWTPQRLILPAARRSLKDTGRVITLVKPHYEASHGLSRAKPAEAGAKRPVRRGASGAQLSKGVLRAEHVESVLATCREEITRLGWRIEGEIESPLKGHGGNVEFLMLLVPDADPVAAQRPPPRASGHAASEPTTGVVGRSQPRRE